MNKIVTYSLHTAIYFLGTDISGILF